MTTLITTSELEQRLGHPALVVVDVRPIAAYNGWRLQGEARGGHLPGAVAWPLRWFDRMAPAEHAHHLTDKGITPDKTIVTYGYTCAEGEQFAQALNRLGYPDVIVYEAGQPAWAADARLPLERLPLYHKLVHVDWLHELIQGGTPEASPRNGFKLFHVNFGVPEEYAENHLPGAYYLDTNMLEAPDTWNRRSPAELDATLRKLGVTRDTTVIVYGRDTVGAPDEKWPGRRAGQIAATRAALILMYCGVEDVRLLDGGYDEWVTAGYALDTTPHTPAPVASFGATIPRYPRYIADIDEARELIASPTAELVAIRTWAEHIGEVSGYNYIEPRGRIPGSVWGNCGSDAYHMQHYRNVDNTMRPYPEIAARWKAAGITPDKRIAFYCGTGWRASETFFYAHLMGWPDVAVYDGGWFEWSKDPNNPIGVGVPGPDNP
jgi:thiosulfate/3-mercaptopyruvate sulfurtransferase